MTLEIQNLETEIKRLNAQLKDAKDVKRLREAVTYWESLCQSCGREGRLTDFGLKNCPRICIQCMKISIDAIESSDPSLVFDGETS